MKKLVCLLAVFALAVPVYADEITFTASDAGNGQLLISYQLDVATPNMPVGIALKVELSGGVRLDGISDVLYVDPCFPVYLDFAQEDPCDYRDNADPCTGVYGGGLTAHPLADADAPNSPDFPAETFSVCMGRLVDPNVVSWTSGDLVKLQLHTGAFVGSGPYYVVTNQGYANVRITVDSLRGGVVGNDGDQVVTYVVNVPPSSNWPAETTGGTMVELFISGQTIGGNIVDGPMVTRWRDKGRPNSWLFPCHAFGDINADALVNATDVVGWSTPADPTYPYDNGFTGSFGGPYNAACDMSNDSLVNATDIVGWPIPADPTYPYSIGLKYGFDNGCP